MEFSSCQFYGAFDFEFSNTFLGNVCTPGVGETQIRTEYNNSSQEIFRTHQMSTTTSDDRVTKR